jgi:thiol-disulfide isomerase/thioredoxin
VTPGAWIVVAAVLAAAIIGLVRAARDGRFRGTHRVHGIDSSTEPETAEASVLDGTPWQAELGERATLLQFSSAFCAPCRVTRHVLADVAAGETGVAHLEVDAEHHLELVRRLGILRTPTTLVLDRAGREVARAAGAPTKQQVVSALGAARAQ